MMGIVHQVVDWWWRKKTCKCQSPFYEVQNGLLSCKICGKPLHRKDVVL